MSATTRSLTYAVAIAVLLTACTGGAADRSDRKETANEREVEEASDNGDTDRTACKELEEMILRTRRGFVPGRSADILPIPAGSHYIGSAQLPVHTGPGDYLAEVPLVFYGPGVIPSEGALQPDATLADVAPTIADLIGFGGFDAPDGKDLGLKNLATPRLIVTIVWDGAGWNTLREHQGEWPFLKRAMRKGLHFKNATIGSTPSNTAPIHTTIGTGAFPATHGVPHVKIRTSAGGYVDPFADNDGSSIRVPTLGDVYDRAERNQPKVGLVATVNWHLGMIGHGAEIRGGDRDTAVLLNDQGTAYGNSSVYDIQGPADAARLEAATRALDAEDGKLDGKWKADDLTDPALRYATPSFTGYQQEVLEEKITAEGFGADEVPDLMYVNFKQIDDAGHRWGMRSHQVGANVRAADRAFERLSSFLDRTVGEGGWTVIVTADHGQALYPEESGAWPITGSEVKADIERHFEDEGIGVLRVTTAGTFLRDPNKKDVRKVARWLQSYTVEDNLVAGQKLPQEWEGRANTPLFRAVMAGKEVVTSDCG